MANKTKNETRKTPIVDATVTYAPRGESGNAFWIMGFTLRVLYTPREQKRRAILPAALLAGMWVYVGLNGIRHMMIIGIPMLAVAIVQCLCTLREYQWQDGRLCGPEPFWRTQPVRLLEILLASCLCFAAGYVINARVLLPYYGVQDMSSAFFLPGLKTDHYSQIFNGWLLSTGIRYTKQKLVGWDRTESQNESGNTVYTYTPIIVE